MQEMITIMKPGATCFDAAKCFQQPKKKDRELLRRSYSECTNACADQLTAGGAAAAGTVCGDVETVRCACCSVSEDCTAAYIRRIRAAHCGDWVCGLCAEAVRERMRREDQPGGVEEALRSHIAVCRDFNTTTRLNPKLALAGSMRDIARRSFNHRTSAAAATCHDQLHAAKTMARTLSCQSKFFA